MRVGITGSSGYIGRALQRALPPDWTAVALGRRAAEPGLPLRACDLGHPPPPGLLGGLDAVVHLAADTGKGGVSPAQEVAFARELAAAASARGIRFVFLSSQAASPEAPTDYGRTKAAIEQAIAAEAVSLRPGMVYGGEERGLFGTLAGALRRIPARPWLWPAPMVQPIHVDDLCLAIVRTLAGAAGAGGVLRIAGTPVSFNDFLAGIAQHRVRRPRLPVPVPVPLLRMVLSIVGRFAGPRLDAGRLDSLLKLPAMASGADLAMLGIVPRALADGMSRSGTPRRRLLLEGRALSRALLARGAVPVPTLRRYLRALAAHGEHRPLGLGPAPLRWPLLLAALDRPGWRRAGVRGGLAWRMDLACRLCESDPALFARYQGAGAGGVARAAFDFARAGCSEVAARLASPFARRLVRVR